MMEQFLLIFLLFPCVLGSYSKYYYMDEGCNRDIDMTAERIETAKLKATRHGDYRDNMNCVLRIKAPQGKRLMIYFTKIDIKMPRIHIGYSCEDYLELFDGNSTSNSHIRVLRHDKICGEEEPRYAVYTSGRYLTLRFTSDWSRNDDGFSLYFTSFHTGACNGTDEFKCKLGQCISRRLYKDGYNQCGDNSDEFTDVEVSTVGKIVGAVIAVGVICVIIGVAFMFFKRRQGRSRGTVIKQDGAQSVPMTTPTPQQYPASQPGYPQGGYPPAGGYPPQQPGYPPQQPGYPPQPGYPAAAPPPYSDNPYPYGAPQQQ